MQDNDILEILSRRFETEAEADAWYRTQPLPGYSGLTAAELVAQGRAHDVLTYIDAVDAGVYS